jgi:hypothetical protein
MYMFHSWMTMPLMRSFVESTKRLQRFKSRPAQRILNTQCYFAGITHETIRENYWFIFYSEKEDKKWIMSSKEFLENASTIKTGKNAGTKNIEFDNRKKREQLSQFLASDFRRLQSNP